MLHVTCPEYNTYSEKLTYKTLTNNAVKKIPKKNVTNKSNKELKSSSKITIARLYTRGFGTEST
jgi:hypothetical protein